MKKLLIFLFFIFPSMAFAQNPAKQCKREISDRGYSFPGMNPYEDLGSCGADYLARIIGTRQWLNENEVLIISPDPSFPPVLITGNTPLHDFHKYLFIKIKPIQYNTTFGSIITPQTYRVLKDEGE